MDYYGKIIFAIIAIVIGILVWNNMLKNKAKKDLVLQNKRYKILSNISNEYLFEYEIATDRLKLTEKIRAYFKTEENLNNLISLLKNKILKQSSNDEIQVLELFNQDGNQVIFKIIKSIIYDDRGRAQYIVGKLIDISQESAEKEKLIRKSEIDGLTEIYNDVTMKKLIEERMQSRNSKVRDAFILIDCDKFKEINDKYGHLEGDKALKNVSHALKINFRETDIIGRIGGDEFGVYMKNVPSIDFVQKKCEALIVYVQEMDKVFNLKLSIGIALLEDEKTHDELFKKADDALYEAKKTGGGKSVLAK